MKLHKIIFILIVFFKTETLFSKNELFIVNNIQIEKNEKLTNKALSDLAIKKGFNQLISKILLKEDEDKLSDLNFSLIKQLVTYYQITKVPEDKKNGKLVNFSVTFDKDKIRLIFKRAISYSEISDKELYILPVLIKNNEIFIFNNNFYSSWNKVFESDLIEFIFFLKNIELIKNINNIKNNLIYIDLDKLFKEYQNKNLALVLIEINDSKNEKGYIKAKIQGKNISKSLNFNKKNLKNKQLYEEVITSTKKELINLVKSVNLIDIRTPSFKCKII